MVQDFLIIVWEKCVALTFFKGKRFICSVKWFLGNTSLEYLKNKTEEKNKIEKMNDQRKE